MWKYRAQKYSWSALESTFVIISNILILLVDKTYKNRLLRVFKTKILALNLSLQHLSNSVLSVTQYAKRLDTVRRFEFRPRFCISLDTCILHLNIARFSALLIDSTRVENRAQCFSSYLSIELSRAFSVDMENHKMR